MKRIAALLCLLAFASVPLWLRDPYLMNALITTGIFIIAAMSLNLLLGFTGQLSLGHVAFFGIGAFQRIDSRLMSAPRLRTFNPWPPIAFALAIVLRVMRCSSGCSFRVRAIS